MEEQETGAAAGRLAVALVQPVDAGRGRREQVVVAGDCSVGASSQSESSAKRRSPSRIGEVVDLEAVDLRLDVGLARQQHRHHDERPQVRRDAVVEVEPGQPARPQDVGDRRD